MTIIMSSGEIRGREINGGTSRSHTRDPWGTSTTIVTIIVKDEAGGPA